MQDNSYELNRSPQLSPRPDRPSNARLSNKALIAIIIVVVALFGSAIVGLLLSRRITIIREVTQVLSLVPDAMAATAQDGVAYPQTVPKEVAVGKRVALSGGGSFDGTSYCVTGTSTADNSIVYHIDSKEKKSATGACPVAQNVLAPGIVQKLQLGSVGSSSIGLSWQAVSGATGYMLQCSTDSIFSGKLVETVSVTTQGVCTNLESTTKYYIRVQARNQSAAGTWSQSISATTALWSFAPTNLKLTVVSATRVDYSWSPVDGAQVYIVERSTDISFLGDVVSVTQNATSGSSKDLTPSTVYYYHVKAITAQFDEEHAAFSVEVGTLTTK